MFLANQRFISHNLLLYRPSQRSACSQVPSQVEIHQTIGSQLWAGETPDLNQGLQDNSHIPSAPLFNLIVAEYIINHPYQIFNHP
jgi:hypothetical protein